MRIATSRPALYIASALLCLFSVIEPVTGSERPNIVLMMADDMGWGDPGYNGNKIIKTPNLDRMSREGIRFDRFYAASAVCSPTRGACLTGRHPNRYGIYGANVGHLKAREICLAELMQEHGYTTGHFGKWHLGTLTKTVKESNRGGPQNAHHYSPPWEHGFEVCFSTEAKVPTYDPMATPNGWGHSKKAGQPFGTNYWTGPGQKATDNLDGDDSRIIMDRAMPFIRNAVSDEQPFFAVIWFHAPHAPVVGGPEYRALYPEHDEESQHYYACITALDEQVGRLRESLKELNVDQNTMVWFCSDNGPEGNPGPRKRFQGTAKPFRGRKRSLYEGGIRVPGLLVWPERIKKPRAVDMPCVTSDYLPTVIDVLGDPVPSGHSIDGISLLPLIDGQLSERPEPIGFQFGRQAAMSGNRYKLVHNSGSSRQRSDTGDAAYLEWELYDLQSDPSETVSVAAEHAEIVQRLKASLEEWQASCRASDRGPMAQSTYPSPRGRHVVRQLILACDGRCSGTAWRSVRHNLTGRTSE